MIEIVLFPAEAVLCGIVVCNGILLSQMNCFRLFLSSRISVSKMMEIF